MCDITVYIINCCNVVSKKRVCFLLYNLCYYELKCTPFTSIFN